MRERGPSLPEAIRLFEAAIARDSTWAPAWAALAETREIGVWYLDQFGESYEDTEAVERFLGQAETAARRALELRGDRLVEDRCRARQVPRPSVGVGVRVGRRGERGVDAVAVVRRGGAVDRRADERMRELHPVAHLQQPGVRRGDDGGGLDVKALGLAGGVVVSLTSLVMWLRRRT